MWTVVKEWQPLRNSRVFRVLSSVDSGEGVAAFKTKGGMGGAGSQWEGRQRVDRQMRAYLDDTYND